MSERPSLAAAFRSIEVGNKNKFDDLGKLSMWGSIYIESNGTGFPMEFIGDINDSTLGGNLTSVGSTVGENDGNKALPRHIRGIN